MDYYYMTIFLAAMTCVTMRGADKENPYSDLTQLNLILTYATAQQQIQHQKQREKIQQILATAKASQAQKQLELRIREEKNNPLFDSFSSFGSRRPRFQPQIPVIQQES